MYRATICPGVQSAPLDPPWERNGLTKSALADEYGLGADRVWSSKVSNS